MAKFTVRGYLRDIREIYRAASKKVVDLHSQIEKVNRMIAETSSSQMLTVAGKQKALNQLQTRKTELKREIEAVRSQAAKDATEVKNTLDQMFYARFHPAASELDMQTVELIKTGVLSGPELLRMAENANVTMRKVIGKTLEGMHGYEKEARLLMMSVDNPHLRAADELISVGDYSCGGARLSGSAGAETFLKRFDEITDPIIDGAPRVAAVSDYHRPGVFVFEADND